jgi:6-phosphogluconolactonase
MPRRVEVDFRVSQTAPEVAAAAAELFMRTAIRAVETRGLARIAISGGSTPKSMFALLADPSQPYLAATPWARIQLFWVDERCVAPDDAESNYRMTREAMLDKVPLAPDHIHRMEGELDPSLAASRYEAAIRIAFRLEGAQTPTFDLILLGLGPDGHTASLFPHTEGLDEMSRICIANHVPQKDTWRMTLTWPVLIQGRDVVFLIEGAEKAAMVQTVWLGGYDPETYPAQLIRPASGRLTVLLDQAAAAGLEGKTLLELA